MSGDEKLNKFEKAVFSEVEGECGKILQDADSERKQLLEKADNECLLESYDKIRENVRKITGDYVKSVSQYELDSKKEMLRHREELTERVFSVVLDHVRIFTQSGEYGPFLISRLKEALASQDAQGAEGLRVFVRPEDMAFAPQLKLAVSPSSEVVADKGIRLGGLSVALDAKGILIDRTIDTALEEERKRFNRESSFSIS